MNSDPEVYTEVRVLLGLLTQSQREAVELRFGLDGEGERTEAEVAAELGISRASAQNRIECALRKLRGAHPQKARLGRIHWVRGQRP